MTRLRVVVLAGGLSHEREVSLRSGRRVAEALVDADLEASVRDVDSDLLGWLQREKPDCVVPMLHGDAGEGGALQEVLELAQTPYVGSRPTAARVAFDKPIAKQVAASAGIRTPESVALPADAFRELGAASVMEALLRSLGLPLMVKPARGGSALGCTVVRESEQLPAAMVSCFSYGELALIERLVVGTEVAVPVLDTAEGVQAFPAVEIRPDGGIYDFTARYSAGATEFVVPAELTDSLAGDCAQVALTAHRSLGLRDLSRCDLMVDASGVVWFLEANVAPGMTETSLVPLSLEAAGLGLGGVFAELAGRAAVR